MPDQIRVALLDNHPLFRRGIIDAFSGTRLVVVAEGTPTAKGSQFAIEQKPDIVVMEIDMPGDGIELAERILTTQTSARLVILTASSDQDDISEALRIGVHGYILKGVQAAELITALEGIHEGEPYITPALATRLLLRDKGRSFRSNKNGELTFTSRDKQVLSHLAQGLTNDEIAQLLGVNTRTIKHYLTRVFRKMQVRNRVEAVLCAKAMRICD